jgi:chorismate mutase
MGATVEPRDAADARCMEHAQEVIRSAEQELMRLLQKRAEIGKRIAVVRQLLNDLVATFGDAVVDRQMFDELDERVGGRNRPGFTRACRAVLTESSGAISAREAAAELRRRFPELAEHHKDLKASTTTVFHRFVKYSEARCFLNEEGVRVWQWAQRRGDTGEDLRAPEIVLQGAD